MLLDGLSTASNADTYMSAKLGSKESRKALAAIFFKSAAQSIIVGFAVIGVVAVIASSLENKK